MWSVLVSSPPKNLAVVDHAADRDAAEADAVIAALAADQPGLEPLARDVPVARAIFSAVSAASEPEPAKKTWSRSPGASAAIRAAAAKTFGWPWKAGGVIELACLRLDRPG